MTKKQLIEALEQYPDDMDVFIDLSEFSSAFEINPIESALKRSITLSDGRLKATIEVIILSE